MSRSEWAWTESRVLVSVAVRVAGRLGTALSFTSQRWLVAVVLVLAFGAAVSPANADSANRQPSAVQVPTTHSRGGAATRGAAHGAEGRSRAGKLPVRGAVARSLASGSGDRTAHGLRAVRVLQRRLARVGFAPGPIDGRYGPLTTGAVERFQAVFGLRVDGIAGPLTLAALRKPSAVVYPGTGYAGHASGRVRGLQHRLARAGYAPGPIDGRYGPRTEQAVARFQAAHGLGVDGIAGPRTLAELGNQPRTRRHHAGRSARPAGSRHRANRRPHRSRPGSAHRQPRRAPAPRTLAPLGHSTSTRSIGLLALSIALVLALALAATRIVRRRRGQRYAGAYRAGHGAARSGAADAISAHSDPSTADTPVPVPTPELREAEWVFTEAVLLEARGDRRAAIAGYLHADRLGHGAAACNLGELLSQRGELAAAEACFQRAAQRGDANGAFNLAVLFEGQGEREGALRAYEQAERLGDPPATADKARAAARELRTQLPSSITARKGGGHNGD